EENWLNAYNKIKIDEINDPVMQEVFTTKKAILIPHVFEDDRPNHEVCRNFGINGLVMFPLISMGEILGQISIVNLEDKLFFYSETQLQLAQ
uniref:GAF domain-containing protein n=1 Tax=Lysinibacillus sp. D4B1_S16 TaxID=2941231 RepID=UPI0020BD7851